MDEVRRPLFIAPVERNGVEIWREDGITDDILRVIDVLYQAAQKDQNEGVTIIEIILRTGDDATLL